MQEQNLKYLILEFNLMYSEGNRRMEDKDRILQL